MRKSKTGLSIVELVIAVAIITLFLAALVFAFSSFLKLAFSNVKSVKAAFILEETIEVVKFLRDASWEDNIAPPSAGAYYFLNFTRNSWTISSSNTFVGSIFERKFKFEDVSRDSNGKIVETGGTTDPGTKKLIAEVSWWSGNATTTRTASTYITNI